MHKFWTPFLVSLLGFSLFFAWELSLVPGISGPPRPEATSLEISFTVLLILLLALNIGLFSWKKGRGVCPIGTKKATTTAGILGAVTLVCPVCVLVPASVLGISISLIFLTPFLPLLRLIAVILLGVSTWMLWPRS